MQVLTKIYLVLSILSLVSGFAYLAVGYTQEPESQMGFSPFLSWLQIVLALCTLVLTIAYLRGNDKLETATKVCYFFFSAFITYMIYFS